MACLRVISKRINLLQRRVYPSCNHLISDDNDEATKSASRNSDSSIRKVFSRNGTINKLSSSMYQPLGLGLFSCRFMSSTPTPEWSDKVDGIDFVPTETVVPDEIIEAVTTMTSQAVPVVNEGCDCCCGFCFSSCCFAAFD